MNELVFIVLVGTMSGLIAGLMPGVGSTALMITALPLLFSLPPEICIIYYAVAIQSSQYSGSVSAINFGMLGEMTSYPALAERKYILENNLQKTALKFTALGSIISCVLPALCLYPLMIWFQKQSIMMRSDFLFFLVFIILSSVVLLYKRNSKKINFLLIITGILISQIGHHGQGSAEYHFLTFNQPMLFAGIPMISILGGFITVPIVAKYIKWKEKIDYSSISLSKESVTSFSPLSVIRGAVIGLLTGLVPAIGTQIGSNVAWAVESKFKNKQNNYDVLARLTSAESANNASQITVLIPLLLLGIAIVPSEMVLLSILEIKFWMPGENTWTLLNLNFYEWLIISLITCSIVSYCFCYSLISIISGFLKKNIIVVNKLCLLLMSLAVLYAGSLVKAPLFFLITFILCGYTAIYFKKIDFMPLVVGYFLGDSLVDTFQILEQFVK